MKTMKSPLLLWACVAAALSLSSQAPAADAEAASPAIGASAPEAASQAVYVVGSKDPDWKTYRAYVAGLTIHEKMKALAPQAPLRFLLRPQTATADLNGLTMRIVGENTRIAVPIAPDGTFAMPLDTAAAADGAEIVLNRRKGLFRWRPDIHSPGVPAGARRLGDLRLECEVRWAIEQEEVPALMRTVFNAAGGACHSRQIQVDFLSTRPIAALELIAGNRRQAVAADRIEPGGQIYMPPLDDASWPDDTLLQFTYAPERAAAATVSSSSR
jgi:hypothetical protein